MAKLPKSIIKEYGITKKAWEVYRGKSRSQPMAKRRRSTGRYTARVVGAGKRYTKRTKSMLGGLGGGLTIKSVAFGTAGLIVANMYQPFGGAYKPAIDKIAIGLVGPMVGMGQHDMLTVGVKEGLATLVSGYLGGPRNAVVGGDSI